jgi:hypothetical protein
VPQAALLHVAQRALVIKPDAPPADDEAASAAAADAPLPVPTGVTVTRLLVPALQAGCLIGKRGDIIRSIRDDSGAVVRVLGEEELPGCAAPTERVVQVTGEWGACVKALGLVCKQLLNNPLRAGGVASGSAPPHPPRRAGSSPAAAAAAAAAAAGAQLLAAGGGFYAPPGWSSVGVPMGAGGALTPMVYLPPGSASPARGAGGAGGPPSGAPPGSASPAGAGSGAAAPFSAHMGVPTTAVGSIIGKAGANVAQIRALSGARVKVHDATPGAAERLIEITGLPEQVAHAQVLVQGFMMTASANANASGGSGGGGGGGGRGGGGGGSRQAQQAQQNAQAAAYVHAQHAHAPQLGAPMVMAPVMMAPGGAMYGYGQPMMYGGAPGGAAMYPYAMGTMGPMQGMMQMPMQGMMQGMVLQPGGAMQGMMQQPWPPGAPPPYGMQ